LSCDDGIDLERFADTVGNVLALDLHQGAAALEDSPEQRGADQADLLAPNFSLPDLEGHMHALTDFRGKKILLVAWASW